MGGTLDIRQGHYYARELADRQRYEEILGEYKIFLNDPAGWSENKIDACLCMTAILIQPLHYEPPREESCCRLGAMSKWKELGMCCFLVQAGNNTTFVHGSGWLLSISTVMVIFPGSGCAAMIISNSITMSRVVLFSICVQVCFCYNQNRDFKFSGKRGLDNADEPMP